MDSNLLKLEKEQTKMKRNLEAIFIGAGVLVVESARNGRM